MRHCYLVAAVLCSTACSDGGSEDLEERITAAAYSKACEEAEDFLVSRYSGDYFVQALCAATAQNWNSCSTVTHICIVPAIGLFTILRA